jgi:hypothetical protein
MVNGELGMQTCFAHSAQVLCPLYFFNSHFRIHNSELPLIRFLVSAFPILKSAICNFLPPRRFFASGLIPQQRSQEPGKVQNYE